MMEHETRDLQHFNSGNSIMEEAGRILGQTPNRFYNTDDNGGV